MTHRQCKSADYSLNVLSTVGGEKACIWTLLSMVSLVRSFSAILLTLHNSNSSIVPLWY